MWQARRRLRRLEKSVAEARAGQADLARRVELFEQVAAAAVGVPLGESAAGPVPASLVTAARDDVGKTVLVRLDVESRKIIAVIGGRGGDPGQWWAAIRHFTTRLRSVSALHLERVMLPPGLSAVACRDLHDDLAVYVSQALDGEQQRAAVMAAIRASRRAGWRAGLGPAGAGVALLIVLRALLGRLIALLGRAGGAVRTRPAAWTAAATAIVVGAAAAGIFLAAPHQHSPASSAGPPAHAVVLPHQSQSQQRAHPQPGQVQPVTATGISPGTGRGHPAGQPRPGNPAPASAPSASPAPWPTPAPSPTPASPAPSPSSPASSPPGGGTGICVILLGSPVCVPLISLSPGS
jgi:hypothetical protein